MWGRFASTHTDADLVRAFRAEEVAGEQLAPSYNIAPTLPRRGTQVVLARARIACASRLTCSLRLLNPRRGPSRRRPVAPAR